MIVRSDALHLPLRDASVDLIVTSPPYFALRSYRDGGEHYDGQIGSEETPAAFVEALLAATREMVRVLKPTGSIFVNLGDKYAGSGGTGDNSGLSGKPYEHQSAPDRNGVRAYNKATIGGVRHKSLMGLPWRYANGVVDQLGLILRSEIIWSKPNGLPESVTDRVRRSHETWFHFVKQGRYFSAMDDIREAHVEVQRPHVLTWEERKGRDDPAARYSDQNGHGGTAGMAQSPLGRQPGSVWTIPLEPLIVPDWAREKYDLPDHFAAFPQEWPRRLILGWSPSGICTRCGDGRRPLVDGYVCACTPYTDHPANLRHGTPYSATEKKSLSALMKEEGRTNGERTGPWREYHLAGWSPAPTTPAVVLDPFSGTGTVAMVARALGRIAVSGDLSRDYLRLARWRIFESGHAAKSVDRTWGERQGTLL